MIEEETGLLIDAGNVMQLAGRNRGGTRKSVATTLQRPTKEMEHALRYSIVAKQKILEAFLKVKENFAFKGYMNTGYMR